MTKKQSETKTINETWDMLIMGLPPDAENLSTLTPNQALKVLHKFIQELNFCSYKQSCNTAKEKNWNKEKKDWQNFYKKYFNLDCNFSNLVIPNHQPGFDRLLIMAKGLTPNKLYAKCEELFRSWKYTDNLDSITSERTSKKKSYAIWVRDRLEADDELKNLSANDLKEKNIKGITLEERLLFELKYFTETKQHLDIKNFTLCNGSRSPYGSVPFVGWYSYYGWMGVSWYYPDYWRAYLRGRAAVYP